MSTKEWREANKDKMREYRRRHYYKNTKKYIDRSRAQNKERGEWIKAIKSGKSCKYCTESFWACLDFHHRDGTEKEFAIGHRYGRYVSKKRIIEEIAKCDLVCSNCHRKIHNGGLGLMETVRLQSGI